ncbi:MAG: hypothetical protein JJ971_01935 [Balneolaceae bacterium]|nr:hypothetical protein [Balneolaceae bacterium]MBO6545132.1 hypothetical protein [Balneolaceae bacterium]MBO6646528.1 hypothetical protein [Balneolaceae bacterium]
MSSDEYDIEIEKVGKHIKKLRVDAGYTSYATFANDNDIEPKQYWRLESGYDFRLSTLLRLLDIHNITLKEFVDGIEE